MLWASSFYKEKVKLAAALPEEDEEQEELKDELQASLDAPGFIDSGPLLGELYITSAVLLGP